MMRIIVYVIFIALAIPALSQNRAEQTLLLNNGSRISGIIVNDSSGNYHIQITAPQVVAVPKTFVSSVEITENNQNRLTKSRGYYIRFGISMLAGKSEEGNSNMLSISLSNGYRFRNGFVAGLGSGIEEMDMPLLPLYAEFNYHPFNSHASPYIFLKSGYAFSLMDDDDDTYWYDYTREAKGGYLFNAGAGILMNTWDKVGISIAFGYRFQQVSITENSNWSQSSYATEYITRFNRLELQLGFVFR